MIFRLAPWTYIMATPTYVEVCGLRLHKEAVNIRSFEAPLTLLSQPNKIRQLLMEGQELKVSRNFVKGM